MAQNNEWSDDNEKFVLYLDIMGFKDRVAKTEVGELKEMLMAFKTKNIKLMPLLEHESRGEKKQLMKMAQFSDSIVIISRGSTIDDFNRITKASAVLMQTALETGFALRGAIAAGDMVFDDEKQIFFGKALVDAYLLEEQLSYYGIVFHDSAEHLVDSYLKNNIRKKIFPNKGRICVYERRQNVSLSCCLV